MKKLKTLKSLKDLITKKDFSLYNFELGSERKKIEKILDFSKNAVTGDFIIFKQATFRGSWRRPRFDGYLIRICQVLKENYRNDLQHQFFLKDLENGSNFSVMGRNLYKNGFVRVIGNEKEEATHYENTEEKNERGEWSKNEREKRKYSDNIEF